MKRRGYYQGTMTVRAAFAVGKQSTKVMTREYEVGVPPDTRKMGASMGDMLKQVLPLVSNPTNVTLVVSFK